MKVPGFEYARATSVSTQPYKCESCDVDGTFASALKYPEDKDPESKEVTYGVIWQCPECHEKSLDLCPLGPVEPVKGSCLNCGGEPGEGQPCPDCGMAHDEMLAFLRIEESSSRTFEKAESAFDAGLYRHGFAILDALLQTNPDDAKLWASKGTQYQILRLNQAAARCYKRALALAPNPLLDVALACALSDQDDPGGALAIYDALIERADAEEVHAIARANRGNLHEAAGNVELAIADYEEAIRQEPSRTTHYQNYCRLFTKRKRWEEALAVASRGLEAVDATERAVLLVEKARANNELERAEAGLEASEELLALSPDHPRGLFHKAWALGLMGRLDEAAATLGTLLEIDPDSKDGAKALAKIEAARERAKKPWWKFWA